MNGIFAYIAQQQFLLTSGLERPHPLWTSWQVGWEKVPRSTTCIFVDLKCWLDDRGGTFATVPNLKLLRGYPFFGVWYISKNPWKRRQRAVDFYGMKWWSVPFVDIYVVPAWTLKAAGSNNPTWRMGSQDSDTWSITMVIVRSLRIGLWDPLQMAEIYGL